METVTNIKKKATITEIAKEAGVSKTTVSRVLSKSSHVSKDAREKVLKIIRERGYKPSIVAQSLRTKKTRTIGLVLEDIENPFYARLAKGVIDTAVDKNYSVILNNYNYDQKLYEKNIETLIRKGVDGLLLTTFKLRKNIIEYIRENGVPFLFIDYKLNLPNVNYVVNDDYYGAKLATEYLINLGHRKIFFLGNMDIPSLNERFRGFRDTLKQHKINFSKTMAPKYANVNDVYNVVENLFRKRKDITAVFAGNDYMAIKAIEVLNKNSFTIPDDVSIIGYDDLKVSSMLKVPLTTIKQPKYRLGKLATEQLLEAMENESDESVRRIILRPELVIKKSCRSIGGKKSYVI